MLLRKSFAFSTEAKANLKFLWETDLIIESFACDL